MMPTTSLKIRIYNDPCLRKKSSPVDSVGIAEKWLIQEMVKAMNEYKGVGLAAPQVGINKRILIADIGNGPVAIINPQILKKSVKTSVQEEGCLSIPGVTVKIKRPKRIFVKYLDENNQRVEKYFDDLMARVVLHETDHLNGKLIIDYVGLLKRKKVLEQLKALQVPKKEQHAAHP